MKKTIKQLEKEIILLEINVKNKDDRDNILREEFGRAFSLYKAQKPSFDYTISKQEPYSPTWSEIFVQVGKLLAKQDKFNYTQAITNVENSHRQIIERIKKIEELKNNDKN